MAAVERGAVMEGEARAVAREAEAKAGAETVAGLVAAAMAVDSAVAAMEASMVVELQAVRDSQAASWTSLQRESCGQQRCSS